MNLPGYDPKKMGQFRIGSSVAQTPEGKFFAIVHYVTGKEVETGCVDPGTIIVTSPEFDTVEEAKKAGSACLNEGIKLMKKEGLMAGRPGKA